MPLYFAYGSCMSLKDLQRDVPEAEYVGPATLHNYRLAFTIWAEQRSGGVADIVPEEGSVVEGIIFDVPDFVGLDRREGHPHLYKRTMVQVVPFGKERPIEIATYSVVNKQDQEVTPSKEYVEIILKGAVNLNELYREGIKFRFKELLK